MTYFSILIHDSESYTQVNSDREDRNQMKLLWGSLYSDGTDI